MWEWKWIECEPDGFKCFEQPSKNLSRRICFSSVVESDSLYYKTFRNDTLLSKGKTKLVDANLCLAPDLCVFIGHGIRMADVVFGGDSVSLTGRV